MCGVEAATLITSGRDSRMYEIYSKDMDAAFYKIRLRIQLVKFALKSSKVCGGAQLIHFEKQVQDIQQRMKYKFDECQIKHKDGQKHDLKNQEKVAEFKDKYTKYWIMACFTSSKKFVLNALEEIELLCKDWMSVGWWSSDSWYSYD